MTTARMMNETPKGVKDAIKPPLSVRAIPLFTFQRLLLDSLAEKPMQNGDMGRKGAIRIARSGWARVEGVSTALFSSDRRRANRLRDAAERFEIASSKLNGSDHDLSASLAALAVESRKEADNLDWLAELVAASRVEPGQALSKEQKERIYRINIKWRNRQAGQE